MHGKMTYFFGVFLLLSFTAGASSISGGCGARGVWLQVLGSGGPELGDGRASSSYLVWVNGHARVLVDTGSGSIFNFERSGANFADIRTILYSHFHVDHSADLPAYIKGSYFIQRHTDLPLYGPSANKLMPGMKQFVRALFSKPNGAYKYLDDFLDKAGAKGYRIVPHVIDVNMHKIQPGYRDSMLRTWAIPVHHGPIPALAWRVEVAGKVIVFSGDMNGAYHTLPALAQGADILLAHNAVPEDATGVARNLHMPPSVIGKIAAQAKVKTLLLSHRMLRTLGREKQTLYFIRKAYQKQVEFADDLACFRP